MSIPRLRLGSILLLLGFVTPARAGFVFVTPTGSTTGDGSVSAMATVTASNGSFTVVLTNLGQNPGADGQLISGYTLSIGGATGTGTLSTSNLGNISTIGAGGSYTTGTPDPLARWTATGAGASIGQNVFSGGAPNRLIIGPDGAGGFSGLGAYGHANPSITNNHNPSVLGTATFTVVDPGVTSSSVVSSFVFQFGTTPGSNLVTGHFQPSVTPSGTVPGPASILSAGTGLLCVAGAASRGWRRTRPA